MKTHIRFYFKQYRNIHKVICLSHSKNMTGRYVLGSSCRKRQRNLCSLW